MERERTFVCIDLKSFYASVECVRRGLDPMTTRLVVADPTRSEMTICLAVSPAMKAAGVKNRCRLYEIPEGIDYITAQPRMNSYMEVSAEIYGTYLRYVSQEDIHPYSIDECFIDATPYLELYDLTAREFADTLRSAVLAETGIPATVGIGPNLFLAKVALDISAKHALDGVGELDARSFRESIWRHRPITDIWNIGPGIARRLAKYRVFDLKGVTEMDPDVLYGEFGVNAEYLIDHAWGVEPCAVAEIKAYEPESSSTMNGQILPCGYNFDDTLMVLREMVDETALELVDKQVVASSVHLYIGYKKDDGEKRSQESSSLTSKERTEASEGMRGGSHTSVSHKLGFSTNSFKELLHIFDELYCQRVRHDLPIRRINISCGNLEPEEYATHTLFSNIEAEEEERAQQDALLAIKQRFGKGAVMRGTSYKEKARGLERTHLVGGHNA